ncbi:LacI family DNA-binding transcriptional regulator [Stagnihabitans tardus]|uniref:Substrate-binding domain-containing protein n=1 Tax=Stagnihabitans tardus TaxID=2699202 RepID=A0AAE4YDD8_9RHOB|nr:LacI family DNA-binding transcriptional regulator [Stagnihabitans tardus]NBZ90009.1 substrate-binding domain-containing protein [Stagnihabitans tardus]
MTAGRKPTLADIAAKTGYGVNTVSLALRGSTRISQAAREMIEKAAEELDYIPNATAKSLVTSRSHTVGMLVEYLTNPQPTAVATALQREMAARGYSVLFATSSTPEQETAAIDMFRRHNVDGLLIYPVDHTSLDHLRRLRSRNFPVVMLVGARDTGLDAVGVDEFQASYDATTHLIALGHTRIGALGPLRDKPLKLEGFRHAHRVHGLALDEALMVEPVGFSMEAGFAAMETLAARNPGLTAVFASSDMFALGAMRWAKLKGLRVPEDLSVVGYDNIEFGAFSHTTLTSVRNDGATLAKAAADKLLALMEGGKPLPPPTLTLLPGELVIRESSSRPGQKGWVA